MVTFYYNNNFALNACRLNLVKSEWLSLVVLDKIRTHALNYLIEDEDYEAMDEGLEVSDLSAVHLWVLQHSKAIRTIPHPVFSWTRQELNYRAGTVPLQKVSKI